MNFGCGPIRPDGWVNVDEPDWDDAGMLPFPGNSFNYIVANHSFCAIKYHDLPVVLAELHRVLKHGGTLRVIVPDVLKAVDAHGRGDVSWFPNTDGDVDDLFCQYVTWFSTNRTVYTQQHLANRLWERFNDASVVSYKATFCNDHGILELDDRASESIFMEAVK